MEVPTPEAAQAATGAPPTARTSELTKITRAIVTIYKEQFGRGPQNAHSSYAGPNTIICVLEGTLTPVERSLVTMGEKSRLQDLRQLFQTSAEGTFRAAVEEITGRTTVSFMSGNDVTNDVASEIFVFAPLPKDSAILHLDDTIG